MILIVICTKKYKGYFIALWGVGHIFEGKIVEKLEKFHSNEYIRTFGFWYQLQEIFDE